MVAEDEWVLRFPFQFRLLPIHADNSCTNLVPIHFNHDEVICLQETVPFLRKFRVKVVKRGATATGGDISDALSLRAVKVMVVTDENSTNFQAVEQRLKSLPKSLCPCCSPFNQGEKRVMEGDKLVEPFAF